MILDYVTWINESNKSDNINSVIKNTKDFLYKMNEIVSNEGLTIFRSGRTEFLADLLFDGVDGVISVDEIGKKNSSSTKLITEVLNHNEFVIKIHWKILKVEKNRFDEVTGSSTRYAEIANAVWKKENNVFKFKELTYPSNKFYGLDIITEAKNVLNEEVTDFAMKILKGISSGISSKTLNSEAKERLKRFFDSALFIDNVSQDKLDFQALGKELSKLELDTYSIRGYVAGKKFGL